ncbi:unnamed protein product [Rotaria sordida]|uniref:Uncharacterized protein n=2 Tax=Rotaria sordida TaxID=392033 RepID=A0A815P9R5_9BILA|nr:unnamed protein product [Rotaria sordida]CAF1637254.1 unnamed protein product [Rotaria sordida]
MIKDNHQIIQWILYTIIDQINTNLTQYPSSITCEISSDDYYFIPCSYLLNTQGQQIINFSITKQIDIVKHLRIHFYKPIDHNTISLQQISIYGYYAYDQQMIIEQTSHPYQTLISTVYGKQILHNKNSNTSIITTVNDDDNIKLMYSLIKSSTININIIDNSHQISMILSDKYRSFNHYLQLIHLCLKNSLIKKKNFAYNYTWLLPSIAHHKPLLAMNYINKNETRIEYFKQLKICSLSVEFLNEILNNE